MEQWKSADGYCLSLSALATRECRWSTWHWLRSHFSGHSCWHNSSNHIHRNIKHANGRVEKWLFIFLRCWELASFNSTLEVFAYSSGLFCSSNDVWSSRRKYDAFRIWKRKFNFHLSWSQTVGCAPLVVRNNKVDYPQGPVTDWEGFSLCTWRFTPDLPSSLLPGAMCVLKDFIGRQGTPFEGMSGHIAFS